jgi:AraC-like DNA-binding protein
MKPRSACHEAALSLIARPTGEPSSSLHSFGPDELVADLVSSLANGCVVDPYRTTAGQQIAVVQKVEKYIRAFPERRVGVLELRALAGVSKRTLHYAFLEVTGCTPKDFVKAVKLNAARRDLQAIGPGPGHTDLRSPVATASTAPAISPRISAASSAICHPASSGNEAADARYRRRRAAAQPAAGR